MASKKPKSQKLIYSVNSDEDFENEDYEENDDLEDSDLESEDSQQMFQNNISKGKENSKGKRQKSVYQNSNIKIEKEKKERNWVINTGNIAIIASGLSIVLDVLHKLLRMTVYTYGGLIVFLYIISGVLSVFALLACVKNAFKYKQISIDAYFTGVSFIMLILI